MPLENVVKVIQKDKKADIHIIGKYASRGGSNRRLYKNFENAGQFLQTRTADSNTTRSQLAKYVKAVTERQKGSHSHNRQVC